jgi:translocation and assembly module TamB
VPDHPDWLHLPGSLTIIGIELQMFLEFNTSQRFLDIDWLAFYVPEINDELFSLSGQFYDDERYLELNRLLVQWGPSSISTTFEIDGVDLTKRNIDTQLENADYRLLVDSTSFTPSRYEHIIPALGRYKSDIQLNIDAGGSMAMMDVNRFNLRYGASDLFFYGQFTDLLNHEMFRFDVNLDYVKIREADIRQFEPFSTIAFSDWDSLTTRGHIAGSMNQFQSRISLQPPKGNVNLNASADFADTLKYTASLQVDSLNLAHFPSISNNNSSINLTADIKGTGSDIRTSSGFWSLYMRNSFFEDFDIPMLDVELAFRDGTYEPVFFLTEGTGIASGSGTIVMTDDDPVTDFSGYIDNFDLRSLLRNEAVPSTNLNAEYTLSINGFDRDRLSGQINLDLKESEFEGEIIDAQSLSLSLTEAGRVERRLDFTSDIIDLTAIGTLRPSNIIRAVEYWKWQAEKRMGERLWFADFQGKVETGLPVRPLPLQISVQGTVKDLTSLPVFLPDFPDIDTDSDFDMEFIADGDNLSFDGRIQSRYFRSDSLVTENSTVNLQSRMRPADADDNYLALTLNLNIENIDNRTIDLAGVNMRITADDGNWNIASNIDRVGEDFRFRTAATIAVSDSLVSMNMNRFYLGSDRYVWTNPRDIVMIYDYNNRLIVDDLEISSADGMVTLNGAFSSLESDSVQYRIRDVRLSVLSSLIGGRIAFDGQMNASVTTKSLTISPTIEGDIIVDTFELDNRLVGDITFSSAYNPDNRHFETYLSIINDSLKYPDYHNENNGIGNHMEFSGYLIPPDQQSLSDTVIYFNADLQEIDMWFLPLIVGGVFDEVEGRATGSGFVYVTTEDYNFNARFEVDDVYARPVFLNTNYRLSGPIELDRMTGVFIDNVTVNDGRQGTGNLYGIVDLNDFEPEKYLNISLNLDRLQFLNNQFTPDSPFYGNVTGTGEINIIGMNTSPYLRTTQPLQLTTDSRLSIPLMNETSVEEQSRLIRYVDSFDEVFAAQNGQDMSLNDEDIDLGFMELFQFDLQFIAPTNTTIQLVFDPVTGEVLTARGSGRIRITLEDETLQMFGRFNVIDGDYLFVGGDIFSRRFSIREGGSITWDGDPANARVDITASYRARPNIAIIDPSIPSDTPQRVPVDLVLVLRGNLQTIENEFYFEFPNATDASEYTTLLSIINNEEQKLIQATSLLFTGSFIQAGAAGTDPGTFGRDFQGRAAGQAGLSLLSNQITSLLNSNLNNLNLDVDLNLTGLDQADLGVALRLFDDRLSFAVVCTAMFMIRLQK